MIGETVGSYRVTAKVSTGGMGTVYRAEHTIIGKQAAVKVLHPELCYNHEIVNRFFNEAKATTQIRHPGIVEVFDFGYMESGDAYLVMEFLEGEPLARRLKTRGKIDEGEAAMLLRGVCSALAAAHAKKIIHRDLKPDNLFIVPDPEAPTGERVKILDFGIAKLQDKAFDGPQSATKTGAVMGTPTYMSPEQCRGAGEIDHRSDLYALGCIFYELVCGRPPFDDLSPGELLGAHLYIEPDPPSKHLPTITRDAEKLILSLLAKNPADRPQTARELSGRFAAIAQAHGWITQTNPHGLPHASASTIPENAIVTRPGTPTLAEDDARGSTMASSPPGSSSLAPSPLAPAPAVPAERAPSTPKPTTLSGAASASHSVVQPPRSRRNLVLALGGALIAAGIVVIVATRNPASDVRTSSSAAPTPPSAVPTPSSGVPTPSSATPTPSSAVPTPSPSTDTAAVPAPAPAPAAAPAPAPAPVPAPAAATSVTKPRPTPTTTKPPTTKPPTPKPPATKPPTTKPKPPTTSGKILIETDL